MIHYIGWYIAESDDNDYSANVAGNLKMRYVAQRLIKVHKHIKIFSLANRNNSNLYCEHKKIDEKGMEIIYSGGCGDKNKISKIINPYLKLLQFIFYLVFRTKKDDTIYLYHSLLYTDAAANIKKIIKRKIILEIEEIYGYSVDEDKKFVFKEIQNIKRMDAFLFVNEGIPKSLGIPEDKYVVSYGVCDIPKRTSERFDDGKIHVIYAGAIDKRKLGALTAAKTARFLPENYHLHIIGSGTEENVEILKSEINEINSVNNCCTVSYDGYKTGKELNDFLFKCHIGLSSNVMRANFANNSFPSKVITYMCHDLAIVLGYAKAFYDVDAAKDWNFYMELEPEAIANAVKAAQIVEVGHFHDVINKMDEELITFIQRH